MYALFTTNKDRIALHIPVPTEEHEMDVTVYDYLEEYYPLTSRELRFCEFNHTLSLCHDSSNLGCSRLSPHEVSLMAGILNEITKEYSLRMRIATVCLKVCTDLTIEEPLPEEIDLEADDPHLWFTIKDRCEGLLKAYDRLVDQAIWTSEMLGGLEDEELDCLNKTISTLNDRIRTMTACLK